MTCVVSSIVEYDTSLGLVNPFPDCLEIFACMCVCVSLCVYIYIYTLYLETQFHMQVLGGYDYKILNSQLVPF